jgi:Kef-type K+ transport system membrane component KefB
VIAISSAAVNDVIGWLLLALVTTLTVSDFVAGRFALRVAMVAAFGLISTMVVRPLLKTAIRRSGPRDAKMSANLLGGLLAVIFIAAMTTYQIGIFAIFGGFMMGVILYDETELVAAWRARLGDFVTVFFLPIYFTYTGLRTFIGGLDSWADWGLCAAIVATASLTKLCAGYFAARRSGLDLGVISPKLFTMLVIMAIFSTVITTPALRYYLPRTSGIGIERAA